MKGATGITVKRFACFSRILLALAFAGLLSGCVSPVLYGDESGFMGMDYAAKKTVSLGYEGNLRPLEEVGVLALDNRLRVRTIRTSDGSLVPITSRTIGGLGIINTPNDIQIHLLPGAYQLTVCFFIDMGNQGSMFCNSPLDVSVIVEAGLMVQLSWIPEGKGAWSVRQQPVNDEIRGCITRDFSKVMR